TEHRFTAMSTACVRVLIVDDYGPGREALAKLFSLLGWETCTAGTVSVAFERLDPLPDVIVLDLGMPDGPGELLLRRVRHEGIPIKLFIVSTGESDSERLSSVASLHPDLIVLKPIDPDYLLQYCQSELGRRAQAEDHSDAALSPQLRRYSS